LKEVAAASPFPVIASGGISRVEDLLAVRALGPQIEGAIVGKALYDGKLDYRTAVEAIGQG
jgi:phosphoribosylformimino-5-aminoimidazole carboxamide ribotide isomerase